MATVSFSPNIASHVDVRTAQVEADSLQYAFAELFQDIPKLKTYLLNDDGSLRKHVAVIIDGTPIKDRKNLSDPLSEKADIFVMQALSGG